MVSGALAACVIAAVLMSQSASSVGPAPVADGGPRMGDFLLALAGHGGLADAQE
jgi:hypothetical protein